MHVELMGYFAQMSVRPQVAYLPPPKIQSMPTFALVPPSIVQFLLPPNSTQPHVPNIFEHEDELQNVVVIH